MEVIHFGVGGFSLLCSVHLAGLTSFSELLSLLQVLVLAFLVECRVLVARETCAVRWRRERCSGVGWDGKLTSQSDIFAWPSSGPYTSKPLTQCGL